MAAGTNNDGLLFEDETLRDGLQMESRIFSLEEKLHIFHLLKDAGIKRIQVGSFVHPKIVPQMADTDEFIQSIGKQEDTVVSALILNDKGLERAIKCGVPHVSMSVSVSDTHSRKNAGRSTAEALAAMVQLITQALQSGLKVRAGLQSAFGCVYEGSISEDAVLAAAEKMIQAGAREINLADTSGMANPYSIRHLLRRCQQEFPDVRISLHLHDTRGLGLANIFSGYEAGARSFDVCAGGLGGCPFVKGAAGNVSTEDAVNMFEEMGIATGVNLKAVCQAVTYLEKALEHNLPGHMKRVLEYQERAA
ncbi:pyruvate carboxyltransferase [Candidatus Vecturithrix granuli]|uniref:Pyruvate carboxyltransferase n=1 Tax=Vecturithrix granuli TaxID=1499967 RepID=A0A081C9H6_VECG1|nr:pyruvate carboxyltransferase [Candidatus Vecturithrix granuli]